MPETTQSETTQSDPIESVLPPETFTGAGVGDKNASLSSSSELSSSTTRRAMLRAAGLVALVGGGGAVLAACGASDTATPATSTAPSEAAPSSAPASSAAPSASAESSSAAPSASATSKAPSGPSVSTAEVPVGGGFIMPDADFVVTQPTKGSYKAFSKICTHQGCPVSMITNKEIVCTCHNSNFSISDGSVNSGPAQKPLPEAKVTVTGKTITVTA